MNADESPHTAVTVSARPDEHPSPALPTHLEPLADRARGYAVTASSANTRRAYASDWKHFAGWCRRWVSTPSFPTRR